MKYYHTGAFTGSLYENVEYYVYLNIDKTFKWACCPSKESFDAYCKALDDVGIKKVDDKFIATLNKYEGEWEEAKKKVANLTISDEEFALEYARYIVAKEIYRNKIRNLKKEYGMED